MPNARAVERRFVILLILGKWRGRLARETQVEKNATARRPWRRRPGPVKGGGRMTGQASVYRAASPIFRAANKTLSSPSAGHAFDERWDESETKKSARRCTRRVRHCSP